MKPKDKILKEFATWTDGWTPPVSKLRKVRGMRNWYFLYYVDGQIERRETYFILRDKVYLESSDKRYEPNSKWLKES